MICSLVFISCSWERRRTRFLVNHVVTWWPSIGHVFSALAWESNADTHWRLHTWTVPCERFLTVVYPTFKLEPGILVLCNSLSTLTLPTSGSLWSNQAGAMVKSFLKHFLQISLTTLQPLPQPIELLPETHIWFFTHIGKPSKFSGTSPLRSCTCIQRVGKRSITAFLFWSYFLNKGKIRMMDRHWEKSIYCIRCH